jgi:Icc-related predicted phosphoesterase
MFRCFFVSDLHGRRERYERLLVSIANERPRALFLGGDLLPFSFGQHRACETESFDFITDYLAGEFAKLATTLGADYPQVFLILGNDDPRVCESSVQAAAARGVWAYAHGQRLPLEGFTVYGYSHVPPTPFLLKDWERYDVSRYVDPGCVSPEEGHRSIPVPEHEIRYSTIAEDLVHLVGGEDLTRAVFLFHAPPYRSILDRAALDGKFADHVPLDVHVGSIAIQRFITTRQPWLTLHGHVHESARLTGSWRERIGRTHAFSAAHDGPELALVRFDLEHPENATRELL